MGMGVITDLCEKTTYFVGNFKILTIFSYLQNGGGKLKKTKKLTSTDSKLRSDLSAIKKTLNKESARSENACGKLKSTEEDLIQFEKMISIGNLASRVAHELNSPLIAILGLSDLILLEKHPYESIMKDVQEIKVSALTCKRIINDWLGFARHQEFRIQTADISEVIEKTMGIAGYQIDADKIKIIKNYGIGLPKIEMSISHIQQVFLNLILNAVDAMREGGTLTITTSVSIWTKALSRKHALSRKACSNPLKIGSKVVLVKFKDTGKGIRKEFIKKIFKPFFTTKEAGCGTGLGLSVSSGIVLKHKGVIEVSSDGPGKGSVFMITLPVNQME